MNLFRARQGRRVPTVQSVRPLRVRTSVRAGYSTNGGGGWIPTPSIPSAPYLPQGSGCAVPQKAYGDGYTAGLNDSPRR
jgi:hypothetical protein